MVWSTFWAIFFVNSSGNPDVLTHFEEGTFVSVVQLLGVVSLFQQLQELLIVQLLETLFVAGLKKVFDKF
jgi:hypothetical protein